MGGWKLVGEVPPGIRKAVVIEAPHTSNWDFFIGFVAFRALGVKAKFLIKKEAFKGPLGKITRSLGGIPVDRGSKNTVVADVVKAMETSDDFILTITPEGTRKKVKVWKSGFYQIVQAANVPLILGFMNYKTKEIGLIKEFHITGDYKTDLIDIQKHYIDKEAKHPENFYLPDEVYEG